MSLPTCREIVAQLPHLPHTERIRLVVRAARKHAADAALPSLLDELAALSAEASGHETTPPPRYTEASLVKALEEREIGRPST